MQKDVALIRSQGDRLKAGLDRSLTYRFEQLRFPVFQALTYDEEHGRYVLPAFAADGSSHFVEFQLTEVKNTYSAIEAANVRLIDNDNIKTIRINDGTKYVFVRYPDGEFRC